METDSGNSTVAAYTLAPELYGALVSQRRSGASAFHHYDALGSTDRLTDSSANTLASYLYRAFGDQSLLSGSSANRFTWVGRLGYYRQPDSADYWVRARVYRPTIGRWVSRDPVLTLVSRAWRPARALHTASARTPGLRAPWDVGVRTGRFDPRMLHAYVYAGQVSVMMVDPSGLHPGHVTCKCNMTGAVGVPGLGVGGGTARYECCDGKTGRRFVVNTSFGCSCVGLAAGFSIDLSLFRGCRCSGREEGITNCFTQTFVSIPVGVIAGITIGGSKEGWNDPRPDDAFQCRYGWAQFGISAGYVYCWCA